MRRDSQGFRRWLLAATVLGAVIRVAWLVAGWNDPIGFEDAFFYSAALRVAGGTDEVQRNIIAERVLGLPADVRIDKNLPFREVPTGPRG